jgi:hypothetical protein
MPERERSSTFSLSDCGRFMNAIGWQLLPSFCNDLAIMLRYVKVLFGEGKKAIVALQNNYPAARVDSILDLNGL